MLIEHATGGYRFLPGSPIASKGVVALPGMTIERAAFPAPVALEEGYGVIDAHLERIGRPTAALCSIDLRLHRTLDLREFLAMSRPYKAQLERWGLCRDGMSTLARTNVAPVGNPPEQPSVVGFSYALPGGGDAPFFALSGAPDERDGSTFPHGIVRRGETSEDALVEKLRCVVDVLNARTSAMGVVWDESVSVQLYSAHAIADQLRRVLAEDLGVNPTAGITWLAAAAPVFELELEIDIRRNATQVALP